MLSCASWLASDALTRYGFHLESAAGRRWAVRDGQRFEIDPVCGCPLEWCPPLPTTDLSLEKAA